MKAKKPATKKRAKRKEKINPETQRLQALIAQLPFVGPRGKETRSWWALPAKGEYMGGCDVGTAAAHAFLKYLREDGRDNTSGTLQHVALDMLSRKKDSSSLRGQAVGFFSVLDYYLRRAALLDSGLDYCTFEGFKQQIEKGLAHTSADDAAKLKEYHEKYVK